MALRQRGGRMLKRRFLRETEGVGFARERIAPGSTLWVDEVARWDLLEPLFDVSRNLHSVA